MSNPKSGSFPSGDQFEIRRGTMRAVITEMGAGLRALSVGDLAVLDGYDQRATPSMGHGQVLIPFPNRIANGTYVFRDVHYQLPLNEVAHRHAIHGFSRSMNWRPTSHDENSLVMSLVLHAQPGYPFVLSLQERYTLTETGLEVQTTARNSGTDGLPYGVGHHPYVTVGSATIDEDRLHISAESYFRTDQQLIPVLPPVSVSNTTYDFRTTRTIGETSMDIGFTDLIRDADGFARVTLSSPDGRRQLSLYVDSSYRCLQIFTGDTVPDRARRRCGLAIEPYTCAANAYNNQYGLLTLEPGQSCTCTWGISVSLDESR